MTHLRRTVRRLALLTVLAALAAGFTGVGRAAAAADLLILDSTVSGGASSQEAQAATSLGLTFEIVDAATWGSMTQAQFASYKAIVLGDPTCIGNTGPIAAAEANRAVWSPAVTGNVIIIGTDPTFHSSVAGARNLIRNGIGFAAAEPGETGAYITLSCYYAFAGVDTPVPLLDAMSPFGGFKVRGQFVLGTGCPADSHIVATHPALATLTDADLSNWGCSTHESFDEFPADFQVLAINRDIAQSFTAPDGTVGGPYIIARGVRVISDIALSPASATNPLGTSHTLTATVTTSDPTPGTPVAGTTVTFTVVAGPHAGVTGTAVTDGSGVAIFSYIGTTEGTDLVEASFVDAQGRTQRSDRVEKTWTSADTLRPACSFRLVSGPPKQVVITVQDTGSGLAEILVTKSVNADTVVPPFTVGTTDPVVVTATKIDQTASSQVEIRVRDVAGNVTICDPVLTLQVRSAGRPTSETFTALPEAESKVTITNGDPGVNRLDVVVNGVVFKVTGLKRGEVRTLDVAAAMEPGSSNTVTLTAHGRPGASVDVVIADAYV